MRIKILTLWLILITIGVAQAAPVQFKPFQAQYDVYRNEQYVGTADFSFTERNGAWIWYMQTEPRGLYKWLTRKTPFSETLMMPAGDELRLLLELVGDYKKQPPEQKTWFDQKGQSIYYSRKNKQKQYPLPAELYTVDSIHLLHRRMQAQGVKQLDINFYKKGKLFNSRILLETNVEEQGLNGLIEVDKMTQQLDNTDYRIIYFYTLDTLAPLKIEQIKTNGNSTLMWRTSVN